MRRFGTVLMIVVTLAGAFVIVRRVLMPPAPPPAAAPPPAEIREPPLQSDAEGDYIPGYAFTVGRFRFAGFSLRPQARVVFALTGGGAPQAAGCLEAQISPQSVRLRCDHPQVGIVTLEGRFLTRAATSRLDVPVVSAVVTVRARSGEIVYSAQDSFVWQPER